jgi:hypothetical protein
MTSLEQIESNRRNALRSTGPKTETGKQRSSKNAVRHGLTAETVIEPLEDSEDYKAFEQAVTADYDAETAVERELVLRLASLLWRLRRSTSIETGLFQIKNVALHEHRTRPTKSPLETSHQWRHCESVNPQALCGPWSLAAPMKLRLTLQQSQNCDCLNPNSISLGAFWVSPISTTAFSNGSGVMRWHSGAKSGRRYLRWKVCGGDPALAIDRGTVLEALTGIPSIAEIER